MTPHRPLRVCHLAYSFYENDNRVTRYAETLAARGDAVDVLSLRRHGQARRGSARGVNVHRIQRRSRDEKTAWAFVFKILWFWIKAFGFLSFAGLRKRYDLVHVHNMPDFLVFAAAVPKLLGAKVVLDIHDVLPEFYAGKFGTPQDSGLFRFLLLEERLSVRFADHVIVANHLWHDKVGRRTASADRCTPLLNYPNLEFFTAQAPRPADASRPFVVLYPGTLNHHQGVDIAIAAFAQACPGMPGAELHIYGEGPARAELRQQADALGVGERVVIRDPVPIHDVPGLMASADLGVVPKRADGFGNEAFSTKTLEFMAAGVPVVVARTKVDAYYFDDRTVKFFTPGDAESLAAELRWAFAHPAELRELVVSGRRLAEEYSWQRHALDYATIADALTGASHGRTSAEEAGADRGGRAS